MATSSPSFDTAPQLQGIWSNEGCRLHPDISLMSQLNARRSGAQMPNMLEDNSHTTQDEQANSGSQEADAVINLFLPQSFSWKARWEAASAFN